MKEDYKFIHPLKHLEREDVDRKFIDVYSLCMTLLVFYANYKKIDEKFDFYTKLNEDYDEMY